MIRKSTKIFLYIIILVALGLTGCSAKRHNEFSNTPRRVLANGEIIRLNDKEVVLDTESKVMWQDNIDTKAVTKSLKDSFNYCKTLSLASFNDWRLPNVETLITLYPKKQFLTMMGDNYWSSSGIPDHSKLTWAVDFYTGTDFAGTMYDKYYVRCVRDSSLTFVPLSVFLPKKEMMKNNSVVLQSLSRDSSAEFLVQDNGQNYIGTKDSILAQLGVKVPPFSQDPYLSIQKQTQEDINHYLTIATIPSPTLPSPLNLVKDEFETKAEFSAKVQRVSAVREAEIIRLQEKYRHDVEARNAKLESRKDNLETKKKEFLFQNFALVMGEPKLSNATYDPESNRMFVDVSMSNAQWSKKVGIAISDRNQAKAFKNRAEDAKPTVSFAYENDAFVLKSIEVDFASQKYLATLTDTDFKPEYVAVTLENKKVAFNELQNPNLIDKYQVSALGYGESASVKGLKYDDDLTPLVAKVAQAPIDSKKWLFAISVEKYDEADPVIYATNSANSFISVMQKRLGIDERHTYALLNDKATTGGIKGSLERLLQNVQPGDSIYFYYSGHGIPDPKEGEPYILPRDVIADYVTREKDLMARSIYKKLSDSSASRIVAFVDSCYSGRTDGISNIKGAAAGHFKSKTVEFNKEKMAVFTAGTNGQFSNAFPEKGNRLFSYYLTKALATKENLDLDTLSAEVYANVKEESLKMGDIKRQEPQIEGNRTIGLK